MGEGGCVFPYSTVFIFALTFCHFQHLSSLRSDKVRLHDEAAGATVEGEFLLFEYSSFCESPC